MLEAVFTSCEGVRTITVEGLTTAIEVVGAFLICLHIAIEIVKVIGRVTSALQRVIFILVFFKFKIEIRLNLISKRTFPHPRRLAHLALPPMLTILRQACRLYSKRRSVLILVIKPLFILDELAVIVNLRASITSVYLL